MLHWDDIKVGEILQWDNDEYPLYKIESKVKKGDGWIVAFRDMQDGHLYEDDYRVGIFNYATRYIVKTAEQLKEERAAAVISKIKYLDERFNLGK